MNNDLNQRMGILDRVIWFCLRNKLVVTLVVMAVVGWGVLVAPFDWDVAGLGPDATGLGQIFWYTLEGRDPNGNPAGGCDVGARTIEINRVEYVIRGLGFIEQIKDIEKTVIKVNDNVPVTIKDVAKVSYGPALDEFSKSTERRPDFWGQVQHPS